MARMRTSRRNMERYNTIVQDTSVSTSMETIEIHESDSAETLQRVRINIELYDNDTNAGGDQLAWVLCTQPKGVNVETPSFTQTEDRNVGMTEIDRGNVVVFTGGTGLATIGRIERDIKVQRKMKAGDKLVFNYQANSTTDIDMVGVIYAWYKE